MCGFSLYVCMYVCNTGHLLLLLLFKIQKLQFCNTSVLQDRKEYKGEIIISPESEERAGLGRGAPSPARVAYGIFKHTSMLPSLSAFFEYDFEAIYHFLDR